MTTPGVGGGGESGGGGASRTFRQAVDLLEELAATEIGRPVVARTAQEFDRQVAARTGLDPATVRKARAAGVKLHRDIHRLGSRDTLITLCRGVASGLVGRGLTIPNPIAAGITIAVGLAAGWACGRRGS